MNNRESITNDNDEQNISSDKKEKEISINEDSVNGENEVTEIKNMTISIDEKDEEIKKIHQPRLPSPQMNNKESITNENDE